MRDLFISVLFTVVFKTNAYRVFDVNGVDNILAIQNEKINIECKTPTLMPMAYCGFIHPSGKRYSFSGPDLADGRCFIRINATKQDTGLWKCHVGRMSIGLEIMQEIQVRVVGKLAAIQSNVTAVHRKPITLMCATTKGLIPLSYCRFEPPNDLPFSIDSEVTYKKSIQNKYYFPPNKSLVRGDCGVIIRKVKYEDVGLWTCGAGLDDGKEHIDFIRLDVEGIYTMSTASATGLTFGIAAVVAGLLLLGMIAWKRRRFLGTRRGQPEVIEIQEIGPVRSEPRTPQPSRSVPSVAIESPSDPGLSPLMT